jgi:tetratricopeptide (TPR) repeat protein
MEWNWHIAVSIFSIIIVGSFVVWLFIRSFKNSESPGLLIFKWGLTLPVAAFLWFKIGPMLPQGGGQTVGGMLIAAAGMGVIALLWRGSLIESVVKPFTNLLDGGSERPDDKPFYSIVNAKRNKGDYTAAIAEARKQLERFPADFEGIMLIAAIQAENQNDLQAAENTLNKFCEPAKAPDKQVAAAWTTMADWHLKIGVDVDSARASLQRIITRFPETELALKAEQRLAHLESTEKILLEHHDRQRIVLKKGVDNIGLMDSSEFLKPKEIEPGKLAAAYVKQLETHPHDSETREKLATIYARDFQRLDLATMELQQLINEKRHSPKQIAGWLNLLANYQTELGADLETVRATLNRIVEEYPDLPLAEITKRRLARVEGEFRAKEKSTSVKLGNYEQNIGLKYGRPERPG